MSKYIVSEDFLNIAEYCCKADTCCEECASYNAECICIWFYVNDLISDIENGFEED